jgi:hypothetical protein
MVSIVMRTDHQIDAGMFDRLFLKEFSKLSVDVVRRVTRRVNASIGQYTHNVFGDPELQKYCRPQLDFEHIDLDVVFHSTTSLG